MVKQVIFGAWTNALWIKGNYSYLDSAASEIKATAFNIKVTLTSEHILCTGTNSQTLPYLPEYNYIISGCVLYVFGTWHYAVVHTVPGGVKKV